MQRNKEGRQGRKKGENEGKRKKKKKIFKLSIVLMPSSKNRGLWFLKQI